MSMTKKQAIKEGEKAIALSKQRDREELAKLNIDFDNTENWWIGINVDKQVFWAVGRLVLDEAGEFNIFKAPIIQQGFCKTELAAAKKAVKIAGGSSVMLGFHHAKKAWWNYESDRAGREIKVPIAKKS